MEEFVKKPVFSQGDTLIDCPIPSAFLFPKFMYNN